ncbi:MAG: hypothetical protein SFY81_00125 [Verrucomicrobiota bacterium]|nr:hypothetical protein [Verrucomicrobiota bacterium]
MPNQVITPFPFAGWNQSLRLTNSLVEVIIVPEVGRVMDFRWSGSSEGPFWINPLLLGKAPNPDSTEWGNFGGDKTWPAPQSAWQQLTGRGWPPPRAFDSMAVMAKIEDNAVILTSPVDPHFGIQTQRRIWLDPDQPVMKIVTRYIKISGAPSRVGIWIITQLDEPVQVYAPIAKPSLYPEGYNKQTDDLPLNFRKTGAFLAMTRNPRTGAKIGTDGTSLLWVGQTDCVRIDSPRIAGLEYPDNNSSAEIWTNPDPLPYIELELLGPLHTLQPGDQITQTNVYTLIKRVESDPDREAARIYNQQ